MRHFIKEYTLELAAGGFLIFGIFLLIADNIRNTIMRVATNAFNTILPALEHSYVGVSNHAATISTSEVVGGLLIVGALGFVIWRVRSRFQTGQQWGRTNCPKCSKPIRRIHRRWWDRVLGVTLLPEARRFRCVNPQCRWSGLLRRDALHNLPREEQQHTR